MREAPPGGAFGPPLEIPGSANLRGVGAALASDGPVLIAGGRTGEFAGSTDVGPSFGPAVALLRRGREPFGAPTEVGFSPVGSARTGVARDGRGVAVFVDGGAMVSVVALGGAGSVKTSLNVFDVHVAPPPLAVRDDGAALVGLQFHGVLERSAEGEFERRPPVIDRVLTAVALSEGGSLVGWPIEPPEQSGGGDRARLVRRRADRGRPQAGPVRGPPVTSRGAAGAAVAELFICGGPRARRLVGLAPNAAVIAPYAMVNGRRAR